jgi:hypothetical protein
MIDPGPSTYRNSLATIPLTLDDIEAVYQCLKSPSKPLKPMKPMPTTTFEPSPTAEDYVRSKMSDDDKLLIDKGLITAQGVVNHSGMSLLTQILWEENKSKVIDFVKKLDAEKKTK